MDTQDILKFIVNDASANSPLSTEFLRALLISSTKADPIDRKEGYYNDWLDYFEKLTLAFIRKHAGFFDSPDSICEAFRMAIIAEKFLVRQQAEQAKKKRDESTAGSQCTSQAT